MKKKTKKKTNSEILGLVGAHLTSFEFILENGNSYIITLQCMYCSKINFSKKIIKKNSYQNRMNDIFFTYKK